MPNTTTDLPLKTKPVEKLSSYNATDKTRDPFSKESKMKAAKLTNHPFASKSENKEPAPGSMPKKTVASDSGVSLNSAMHQLREQDRSAKSSN